MIITRESHTLADMEESILNSHNKAEYEPAVDLSKLPEDASDTLRIVRIGDYDACACIGAHVSNTSEIGEFKILNHDFNDGIWRLRWKVIPKE